MYLGLPGRAIPEICGGSPAWHTHPEVCITETGMTVGFAAEGACPAGQRAVQLPPMLHVWLVPNAGGPWDDKMDPQTLVAHFD